MSVLDLVSRLAWKRQIQSSLPIPPYSGLEMGGGIGRGGIGRDDCRTLIGSNIYYFNVRRIEISNAWKSINQNNLPSFQPPCSG